MARLFTKKLSLLIVWLLAIVYPLNLTHALFTQDRHHIYDNCLNSVLSDLKMRAEHGDADALFEHGVLLFYGHCLRENKSAGLLNLKTAVSKGHIEAAFFLGDIYSDKSLQKLHDPYKAHKYLLLAAEKNHVPAQHILGIILVRGDLGREQQHQGLYWLGVAASGRHQLSAIIMGHLHEHGKFGIKQDPCLARDWYELCFNLGIQEAKNFIHTIDTKYTCN